MSRGMGMTFLCLGRPKTQLRYFVFSPSAKVKKEMNDLKQSIQLSFLLDCFDKDTKAALNHGLPRYEPAASWWHLVLTMS